jgi:hypothetical protein
MYRIKRTAAVDALPKMVVPKLAAEFAWGTNPDGAKVSKNGPPKSLASGLIHRMDSFCNHSMINWGFCQQLFQK